MSVYRWQIGRPGLSWRNIGAIPDQSRIPEPYESSHWGQKTIVHSSREPDPPGQDMRKKNVTDKLYNVPVRKSKNKEYHFCVCNTESSKSKSA